MKTLFFTGLVASLMMSSTALLGQGMSVSPEVVKASCKVRDGAVTKSFKISSSGKVDLRISCQADKDVRIAWTTSQTTDPHTVSIGCASDTNK